MFGLILIAVVLFLSAIASLLSAVTVSESLPVVALANALVYLALGVLLLRRVNVARVVLIVLTVISLLMGAWGLLWAPYSPIGLGSHRPFEISSYQVSLEQYLPIAFNLVIVWYLTRKSTRELFLASETREP